MTSEELSRFDGREGRPAYVAVSDVIYDLSASPRWTEGDHEGLHQAGRDLSEELKTAPHIRAVVERFPVVGRLEDAADQPVRNRKRPWLPIGIAIILLLILLVFLLR